MTGDNPPVLIVNGPIRTPPNHRKKKNKPQLVKRKTELKCLNYTSPEGRRNLEEQAKYAMFGHLDRESTRLWHEIEEIRFRLNTVDTILSAPKRRSR